jgi:hypothetical protein
VHVLAHHGIVGELLVFWPAQIGIFVILIFSWRDWRRERRGGA